MSCQYDITAAASIQLTIGLVGALVAIAGSGPAIRQVSLLKGHSGQFLASVSVRVIKRVLLMLYHSQATGRSTRDGQAASELDLDLQGIQPFHPVQESR